MMKRNLVCEQVAYSFDNKKIFSNISFSIGDEKIGLVGCNGVGKTTLIRLLVGQLRPQAGTIFVNEKIAYLPQQFNVNQDDTIAKILGVEQKFAALKRINAEAGTPDDFDMVKDDWNVHERTHALLCQVNLEYLAVTRTIKTLSGGETTRLFFAQLLVDNPDILILDEPTNNLDNASRQVLYNIINSFKGGILVVSHDRKLLSSMDQIIELTSLGAQLYGGNYDVYLEQKRIAQEALEQQVNDAQKFLKKTKKVVQRTKERFDQRTAKGNRERRTHSQPTICLDYHKERAERTKSKLERKTDKQLASVKEQLLHAKSKLEQRDYLDFDLEATRVHNTKIVLDIQHLSFDYASYTIKPTEFDTLAACPEYFAQQNVSNDATTTHHEHTLSSKSKTLKLGSPLINDFNLTLVGPKRIAIAGPNGSGKTTLLKLIMQRMIPNAGFIKIEVDHRVYLDQNLSILDQEQTILENFKRLNPTILEADCRLRLATFLFSREDVDKPVAVLSGGEKMRVALVCIFKGETPPQLIILDEPTNNMDLESIESMERALQNYRGALIVVSHDDSFLEHIGVQEKIKTQR